MVSFTEFGVADTLSGVEGYGGRLFFLLASRWIPVGEGAGGGKSLIDVSRLVEILVFDWFARSVGLGGSAKIDLFWLFCASHGCGWMASEFHGCILAEGE